MDDGRGMFMDYIAWSEDLSIGVPAIDAQHKELFRRINSLLDACHQAKGREAVSEILGFLANYVLEHFATEEKLMSERAYPRYEEHRREHEDFKTRLAALSERFAAEGPGIHIIIATNSVVVTWLNRHIRHVDRALGGFLKER